MYVFILSCVASSHHRPLYKHILNAILCTASEEASAINGGKWARRDGRDHEDATSLSSTPKRAAEQQIGPREGWRIRQRRRRRQL